MHLAFDLGTCNSSAALMIDGKLRLVKEPVKQGYSVPSSIYVDESGQILIGHLAESKKFKDISRYRSQIKPDLIQDRPYLLGQNGEYEFTAQQLITEILKTFKQEAEKITLALDKGEITDVVITIPATYRKNKRDAMIEVAKNAGFISVQLIEEPIAAAIYYHQQNPATFNEEDIILIYDLGGGTFDATLIKKLGNGFQVLSQPVGIENCGGINFDRAIFQHLKASCSEHLQEKLSTKGNSPEKNFLIDFCRSIKHQFSATSEAVGHIPIDYQLYELSRDDFNLMIDSFIEQTIVCCEHLIKSAGLDLQDVSKVLMVGGSCRIPYVQESVEKRLQSSALLIDEPELAVCQGAAIYGNKIEEKDKPDVDDDWQEEPEEEEFLDGEYYNLVVSAPNSNRPPSQWRHHRCRGNLQIADNGNIRCLSCKQERLTLNWYVKDNSQLSARPFGMRIDDSIAMSFAGQIIPVAGQQWMVNFLENIQQDEPDIDDWQEQPEQEEELDGEYYNLVVSPPNSNRPPTQWQHHRCQGKLQIADNGNIRCSSCGQERLSLNWYIKDNTQLSERPFGTRINDSIAMSFAGQMIPVAGQRWMIEFLESIQDDESNINDWQEDKQDEEDELLDGEYYDLIVSPPGSNRPPTQWQHHRCRGKLQIADNGNIRCSSCGQERLTLNWYIKDNSQLSERPFGTKINDSIAMSFAGQMIPRAGQRWMIEFLENIK